MKKKLAAASALLVAFGLFACGGNEPADSSKPAGDTPTSSKKEGSQESQKHEHTFDETKWEKNDSYHWHAATCEHNTQTKDKAAHDYETTVITEATCSEAGSAKKTCKVCGFEKTEDVPAKGHEYEKAPLGTTGDSKYTCKSCGDYYYAHEFDGIKPDKGSKLDFKLNLPKYSTVNVGIIAQITSSDHTNRYFYCDPEVGGSDAVETNEENKGKIRYSVVVNGHEYGNDNEGTYGDNGFTTTEYSKALLFHKIDVEKGENTFTIQASDILGYRLKIAGIYVEVVEEYEDPTGFTANFSCDSHVKKVLVYKTQDYATETPVESTTAISRDGVSGWPLNDGEGQISFKVVLEDGYEIDKVTATAGSYKNIKLADEEQNIWRITKIAMNTTITIATKAVGQAEVGYNATFVHDDKVQVKVLPKQLDSEADGVITDTCLARQGKSGQILMDGSDQVNFILIVKAGYKVDAANIAVTPDGDAKNWGNLKQDPDTQSRSDYFRVTKVAGDITITITAVAA